MNINLLNIGIVNSSPFCRINNNLFINPAEFKSLQQWFLLFKNITLFKPEVKMKKHPDGWVKLNKNIRVISICNFDDNFFQRYFALVKNSKSHLCKIDLLYARMPNYESYWAFKVAKSLSIPLIIELHGDWSESVLEEDKRSPLRLITRHIRSLVVDYFIKEMSSYASIFISIGPSLYYKYSHYGKPSLISTNNLLSLKHYCKRSSFSLNRPPKILFVGDIQRRKGLHILFEALNILNSLNFEFNLTLVGSGHFEAYLRNYARKYNFIDSVNFVGRISHGERLFSFYKNSDIFVLPSVASEGVPRVTHEAMALGCPVIATNIGSISWQLNNNSGILIEKNNAKALANAIISLLTNLKLRRKISNNAYIKAKEYSLEAQKKRLRSFIYKNIKTVC